MSVTVKKRDVFLLLLCILFLSFVGYIVFIDDSPRENQKATEEKNHSAVKKIPLVTLSTIDQQQAVLPVLPESTSPKVLSAYKLWTQTELSDKAGQHRFYKVDADGNILPESASVWQCVYDDLTSLLWEVKRSDGGWQDYEHTYSWYHPSVEDIEQLSLIADGDAAELPYVPEKGKADVGNCYDIYCDTYHYAQAFNKAEVCGSSDWRLPYAHELGYLDHESQYYPDIDTHYFPNTAIAQYWSRTETPKISSLAWSIDFKDGFPYISEKRIPYRVRLVVDALDLSDQIRP